MDFPKNLWALKNKKTWQQLPKNIADALVDALQRSPLKAYIQAGPGGVQAPDKPDKGRN